MIVLTRHGKDLAAIVSIAEVRRIWDLQEEAWEGPKNPLTRRRGGGRRADLWRRGEGGNHLEAAHQVRQVQLTRAEERRILPLRWQHRSK